MDKRWSPDLHFSSVTDILPALDLFLKVINCDVAGLTPPRDFCLRLLTQTMEFMLVLLKDGMMRSGQMGDGPHTQAERIDLDKALGNYLFILFIAYFA